MLSNIFPKNKCSVVRCADQQGSIPDTPRGLSVWHWDLSNTERGMDTSQASAAERGTKPFLDMRLPLYWLLSAFIALGGGIFAVGIQFSALSAKMDNLLISTIDLRAQTKDLADKYQTLRDAQITMQYTMQRTIDLQAAQVGEIQRSLGKKP